MAPPENRDESGLDEPSKNLELREGVSQENWELALRSTQARRKRANNQLGQCGHVPRQGCFHAGLEDLGNMARHRLA